MVWTLYWISFLKDIDQLLVHSRKWTRSLLNQMAIPFFVWNNIVIIAWCSVGSVCVVQRLDHCCLGILSPKSGIACILLKFLCISLYYLPLEIADSISLFVEISSSLISEFSKIGCRIGISFWKTWNTFFLIAAKER